METVVQAPIFYTTIHKLPLSRFIDALCDNDLTGLLITGNATEEELQIIWADIMDQFIEASAGTKQLHYIKICAQITRLELKYNMIMLLINSLRQYYVERFADRLNNLLETSFKFNISDITAYDKILERCFNRAKALMITIDLKTAEVLAMREQTIKNEVNPKREHFSKALIALSDHAGRELFEDQITVYVYCERLNRYNKYIDHQKAKTTK